MLLNNINPILLDLGPLTIRWYGLFLGIGIMITSWIIIKLFKKEDLEEDLALSLIIYLFIGGIIGARLGHILFYEIGYYLTYPIEVFFINHGGLSSHGLTLGLLITFTLFVKIKKINWKQVLDLVVIPLPILIIFIRLGNFFNSEIVGRATDLPWAISYPLYELNPIPRHPSQIYEILLALVIFIIIFLVYKKRDCFVPRNDNKKQRPLFLFNIFLLLYFSSRFLIEFTKEFQTLSPDFILTMGQLLSLPFIVWSVFWLYKNK